MMMVDGPAVRKTPATTPPTPDPRIAAESLLLEVLPRDMYVHLAAVGWVDYVSTVTGNKYQLSKKAKTLVTKVDGVWSACIAPEPDAMMTRNEVAGFDIETAFDIETDTVIGIDGLCYPRFNRIQPQPSSQLPPADRVVAEYLLLINDEAKYLATANLTLVRGRHDDSGLAGDVRTAMQIQMEAMNRAMAMVDIARIGRPLRERQIETPLPFEVVLREFSRLMFDAAGMNGNDVAFAQVDAGAGLL